MTSHKLGTDWTPPGEGGDLKSILEAFGKPIEAGDETRSTNIRLTGQPLIPYDGDRLKFIDVGKLGSAKCKDQS